LLVSNLGPDSLAPGDSFKIFNSATYSGAFTNILLPALTTGLAWTNRLLVNGTLAVLPSTTPTNLFFATQGSSLQLSWPADHIGWRLEAQTNSLGTGLGTNWTTMTGSAQTNVMSFSIDSANGNVYYRLTYP